MRKSDRQGLYKNFDHPLSNQSSSIQSNSIHHKSRSLPLFQSIYSHSSISTLFPTPQINQQSVCLQSATSPSPPLPSWPAFNTALHLQPSQRQELEASPTSSTPSEVWPLPLTVSSKTMRATREIWSASTAASTAATMVLERLLKTVKTSSMAPMSPFPNLPQTVSYTIRIRYDLTFPSHPSSRSSTSMHDPLDCHHWHPRRG